MGFHESRFNSASCLTRTEADTLLKSKIKEASKLYKHARRAVLLKVAGLLVIYLAFMQLVIYEMQHYALFTILSFIPVYFYWSSTVAKTLANQAYYSAAAILMEKQSIQSIAEAYGLLGNEVVTEILSRSSFSLNDAMQLKKLVVTGNRKRSNHDS